MGGLLVKLPMNIGARIMKNRVAQLLVVMAMLSATARAAPDKTDAAVTAALLRFIDALEAGDGKTLVQVISILDSPAQELARKNFVELAVAEKMLEKAAIAKFGEEGRRFRCGFDLIANEADRKLIAIAPVR